jgi:hypothetical protein
MKCTEFGSWKGSEAVLHPLPSGLYLRLRRRPMGRTDAPPYLPGASNLYGQEAKELALAPVGLARHRTKWPCDQVGPLGPKGATLMCGGHDVPYVSQAEGQRTGCAGVGHPGSWEGILGGHHGGGIMGGHHGRASSGSRHSPAVALALTCGERWAAHWPPRSCAFIFS